MRPSQRYEAAKQAVADYTGMTVDELAMQLECDHEHPDLPVAVRSARLEADFLVHQPYTVERVEEVTFTQWPPKVRT